MSNTAIESWKCQVCNTLKHIRVVYYSYNDHVSQGENVNKWCDHCKTMTPGTITAVVECETNTYHVPSDTVFLKKKIQEIDHGFTDSDF